MTSLQYNQNTAVQCKDGESLSGFQSQQKVAKRNILIALGRTGKVRSKALLLRRSTFHLAGKDPVVIVARTQRNINCGENAQAYCELNGDSE